MVDDSMLTQRLRQLAEVTDEELETGDTLELEELDLMETCELKQLLEPGVELTEATGSRKRGDESQ